MRRVVTLLAAPMLALGLSACSNPEEAYTPVDELPSAQPAPPSDDAATDPAATPAEPMPEPQPPASPDAPPES